MFFDDEVRKGLGAANQLKDYANLGEPPQGLLALLKHGPGAHIKKNVYDYQKALSKETARIKRIEQLRAEMLGLVGTWLAALFVAIGTFFGNAIYNGVCTDDGLLKCY